MRVPSTPHPSLARANIDAPTHGTMTRDGPLPQGALRSDPSDIEEHGQLMQTPYNSSVRPTLRTLSTGRIDSGGLVSSCITHDRFTDSGPMT